MFFEWSDKIRLDVPQMDREHMKLIDLMNELHALNESGAQNELLLEKFDELLQCARDHFADEEAYMASISFPKLSNHAMIHKQLLGNLEDYRDHLAANAGAPLQKELFLLLKGWLTTHILGIDRQYAAHSFSVQ